MLIDRALLCAVTATATCVSQSVVLPSARATSAPPVYSGVSIPRNETTFSVPESHTQLVFDVSDIAPPFAFWTLLQMRLPANFLPVNVTFSSVTARIVLAIAPRDSRTMTTTFVTNLAGAQATTAFTGTIALPHGGPTLSWPQPWGPPILFAAPFFYLGALGKSLVMDIVQSGGAVASSPYPLEATAPDYGTTTGVGSPLPACRPRVGNGYTYKQAAPTPYVGSTWSIEYRVGGAALALSLPCFAMLGVTGPAGSWGGTTLPLDLTPLGAPSCLLDVSPDILIPLTADPNGNLKSAPIPIPNQPTLGGQMFYDQGLVQYAGANPLGMVTTVSSQWTIGTAQGEPGATVSATGAGAKTAASGTYSPFVTTILLN